MEHLHSMVVHAVVALAVVAAGAFALLATGTQIAGRGGELWTVLLWASLIGVVAISVPATLTGISARDRTYATWHPSHRVKLVLSLVLIVLVTAELAALARGASVDLISWLGAAVVLGNLAVVAGLAHYGLRLTLGSQSLARTSYLPDMWREPPVDILDEVATVILEPPRSVNPLEESAR